MSALLLEVDVAAARWVLGPAGVWRGLGEVSRHERPTPGDPRGTQ
jgi:hypothetical protein